MNKGFASLAVVAIVSLAGLLITGGGFGAYKYSQVVKEKQEVERQLILQKDKEIEDLKNQLSAESVSNVPTSTTIATGLEERTGEQEEVMEPEVIREVVYVPQPVPEPEPAPESDSISNSASEPEPESVLTPEPESQPEPELEFNSNAVIEIASVGQTAFDDGYGGVYGAYGLELSVTAIDEDILIPLTTSDSVGSGLIGFSYSVDGDNFSGNQDSEITTCTAKRDNFCIVQAGRTKPVKVTVWLTPDSETDGNYGVTFNTLTYFEGTEQKTFSVDSSTARINIYY